MTPCDLELQHLLNLMAEPYRKNWKAYCWAKATALAAEYPEDYGDLPRRLTEAMQATSNGSGPERPSTGKEISNE